MWLGLLVLLKCKTDKATTNPNELLELKQYEDLYYICLQIAIKYNFFVKIRHWRQFFLGVSAILSMNADYHFFNVMMLVVIFNGWNDSTIIWAALMWEERVLQQIFMMCGLQLGQFILHIIFIFSSFDNWIIIWLTHYVYSLRP